MGMRSPSQIASPAVQHLPWVLLDALLAIACFGAALVLRFGGRISTYYLDWFVVVAPVIAAAYCLSAYIFNLYCRAWRYASLPDLTALTASVALASTVLLLADCLAFPLDHPLPLSVVPIGGVLTYLGYAATRYAPNLRRFLGSGLFPRGHVGVVIVGADTTGALLAREMLRNGEWDYQPVCFVDEDPTKQGLRIHGVPVRGTRADIPRLVRAYGASVVALAMPSATPDQVRALVDVCQPLSVRLLTVPSIPEILCGKAASISLREIRIEDLLGRDPVSVDLEACRTYLAGRVVLVTGAAGSIGSELCRQVLALDPSHLILFDNNETGVHDLALELRACGKPTLVYPCVGSVTDLYKVDRVFDRHRPQVVFHAAAYKHVPLMEEYPEEAVTVNVLGTFIVSRAAHRHGVERFVLVSTDKAVKPHNVMGATKRLAELIVKATSVHSDTVFCAVRFGNVLGSRGSVVPIFARQIDRGGPITITDPDVMRYFMTIPEAASLVIQAGAFAKSGEVFVLDMGEQVRIVDLAEKMVRLRGLRIGSDIGVVYTGLRPGEKLTEVLTAETEAVHRTSHPKVMRVSGDDALPDVTVVLGRLERLVREGTPEQVRDALFDGVGVVPSRAAAGSSGSEAADEHLLRTR